jgi:hypothetical protein
VELEHGLGVGRSLDQGQAFGQSVERAASATQHRSHKSTRTALFGGFGFIGQVAEIHDGSPWGGGLHQAARCQVVDSGAGSQAFDFALQFAACGLARSAQAVGSGATAHGGCHERVARLRWGDGQLHQELLRGGGGGTGTKNKKARVLLLPGPAVVFWTTRLALSLTHRHPGRGCCLDTTQLGLHTATIECSHARTAAVGFGFNGEQRQVHWDGFKRLWG